MKTTSDCQWCERGYPAVQFGLCEWCWDSVDCEDGGYECPWCNGYVEVEDDDDDTE